MFCQLNNPSRVSQPDRGYIEKYCFFRLRLVLDLAVQTAEASFLFMDSSRLIGAESNGPERFQV